MARDFLGGPRALLGGPLTVGGPDEPAVGGPEGPAAGGPEGPAAGGPEGPACMGEGSTGLIMNAP